MRAQDYAVNIIGLSQKLHHFDFELGDGFFALYGAGVIEKGNFKAEVTLDKRETMIEARFHIHGEAGLVCDRSLDPFNFPMDIDKVIVFKYGEEEKELSDEIVLITRDQAQLDLGQYLYELIAVQIPMKKLHPRFQDEEDAEESNVRLVYSSPADDNQEEEPVDPRWEKLKKLK